jgi:hypothetical protein
MSWFIMKRNAINGRLFPLTEHVTGRSEMVREFPTEEAADEYMEREWQYDEWKAYEFP